LIVQEQRGESNPPIRHQTLFSFSFFLAAGGIKPPCRHQTLLSIGEVFFVIKVQGKPTLLPIGLPHQGYTLRCYHLNGGKSDPLFFFKLGTSTPRNPEMYAVY